MERPKGWDSRSNAKIDGICVVKEIRHNHIPDANDEIKEWYLDKFWTVATGFCQVTGKPALTGGPHPSILSVGCFKTENKYPPVSDFDLIHLVIP